MRLPRVQFTIRHMMITVAVLTVLLGMTVLALRREYRGLTAVNQSGQVISRMIVNAGGEQSVITDLAERTKSTKNPYANSIDASRRIFLSALAASAKRSGPVKPNDFSATTRCGSSTQKPS